MFRLTLLCICLAAPVFGYSTGGPKEICSNNLTPEHRVEGQKTAAPYTLSGGNGVKAGEKLSLTLSGDGFLGFAIQARNAQDQPVGSFKVVETNKSQTLTCSNADDTLTHKKIPRDNPLKSMEFQWLAPNNYKGKVTFYATVAKDGHTFWVRKVVKEVDVQ